MVVIVIGSIMEEVLCRLFFFDALLIRTLRVRVWLALVAQAIVFSWQHFFLGESYATFRALWLFAWGLVFGIAYWRKGLLASTTLHVGINLIIYIT